MNRFKELGLTKDIVDSIKKQGIEEPTEIQAKTIPYIVKGKDVIGESATGSGKTLAFGSGIIEKVIPKEGIQALVLAPTRELAEQVRGSVDKFSRHKKLKVISIYGGVSFNNQVEELRKTDVVVATPGRLLDHMRQGTISLEKIKILVLDEVDRMLDMGFIDDVTKIIKQCPKKRQTLFFSATVSSEIKKLANRFMKDPFKASAKRHVDPTKLRQIYYDILKNERLSLLIHLLKKERKGLVMVFCNSRRNVDFVAKNLKAQKINAIEIHGGLTQNKRTKTMDMFNSSDFGVLVCTDVAARGLHIENVSHVYNYDIPSDPKDYVHRIGRTARAGEEGMAINLLCDLDHDYFSRILRDYDFNIKRERKPRFEKIRPIVSQNRRRPPQNRRKRGFTRKRR